MKLKNVFLAFSLLLLVFVPLKIYSAIKPVSFIDSPIFLAIFGAACLAIAGCTFMVKFPFKNMSVKKDTGLALISILVAMDFLSCVPIYFTDTVTKYDFEWQPILMSVFSLLSCVTFVLLAITHFKGKNIIAKAPVFIYCPLLWISLRMILFLSMKINITDPYVVISAALIALFMMYYTQTFATSNKVNNVKILFVLGFPLILFTAVAYIPEVYDLIAFNSYVQSSIATMNLTLTDKLIKNKSM